MRYISLSPASLRHKGASADERGTKARSLIYSAELQGYMWAFLIGGFLTRLTIGPVLSCAWRLDAGKSKVAKGRWQQWKGSSNLKAFFLNREILWDILEGPNVFRNLPNRYNIRTILDFPVSFSRCRCTAHYRLLITNYRKIRIFFHSDGQINDGFFNKPIVARTQILVHSWGPRTKISALFRTRT